MQAVLKHARTGREMVAQYDMRNRRLLVRDDRKNILLRRSDIDFATVCTEIAANLKVETRGLKWEREERAQRIVYALIAAVCLTCTILAAMGTLLGMLPTYVFVPFLVILACAVSGLLIAPEATE